MDISKLSDSNLTIIQNKTKTIINFDDMGYISLRLEANGNYEVSKPGEYEYSGISFMGQEVKVENYLAKISFVKIGYRHNINVLVLDNKIDFNKDIQSELGVVNAVITPFVSKEFINQLIKQIDPEILVINLKKADNAEEIAKTFTAEEFKGSFKVEDSSFNSSEDVATRIVLLV